MQHKGIQHVTRPGDTQPSFTTGGLTPAVTGELEQLQIAGFSPVGVDPSHFPQDRNQNTV